LDAVTEALGEFVRDPPAWLAAIIILAIAAAAAWAVHAVAFRLVRWAMDRRVGEFGRILIDRLFAPTRLGLLVLALGAGLQATPLRPETLAILNPLVPIGLILFIGWMAAAVVDTAADIYLRRVPQEAEDPLLLRKHLTQVRLLRRIAVIVVGFLTFSAALMTIPAVREYGVSLFASAGVAGLVVGLAARPVLSNLLAGIQIAVTQPIRIEDTVVVEGENGAVEEITTSYVVIRLWDLRRMVVPLSYFIEKPFQNWTRESQSLIGAVLLYVDYTVPVAEVREKFLELVRASPQWDGKTAALQVTNVTKDSVELRGLASAADAGRTFDLRCELREKMIAWLQSTYPSALPHVRTVSLGPAEPAGGTEEATAATAEGGGET
jgi:small-conductance mechanosensitive channel